MDFPIASLKPTLERLDRQGVPHARRFLSLLEENPDIRWSDLPSGDRAIIQGWSLHLVGMLNRLNAQLQRVKSVVVQASRLERENPHLTPEALNRLAEHHGQEGNTDKANAFRLAAALRTPTSKPLA
ncbi:hypothetical protein JXA47_02470 [Candidatus Sumerlaeota bacterium]|nr:hypothetical protein [Candidatus Sumerlaeota bacterium]